MFDRPQFLGQVPITTMGQVVSSSVSVPRQRYLRRRGRYWPYHHAYPYWPYQNPYGYGYPYQYPYPSSQPQAELVCRQEETEGGEEVYRCRQEPAAPGGDLICRKETNAAGEEVLRCTQPAGAYPGVYPGAYPVVSYPRYFY